MSVQCATYSVRELSQVLGVSVAMLYREVRKGAIPHVKVGSRILVPKEVAENLLRQYRTVPEK